jgi:hypothetical protein
MESIQTFTGQMKWLLNFCESWILSEVILLTDYLSVTACRNFVDRHRRTDWQTTFAPTFTPSVNRYADTQSKNSDCQEPLRLVNSLLNLLSKNPAQTEHQRGG